MLSVDPLAVHSSDAKLTIPLDSDAFALEYAYAECQAILDRNDALSAFEALSRSGISQCRQAMSAANTTVRVVARIIGDSGLCLTLCDHDGDINVD